MLTSDAQRMTPELLEQIRSDHDVVPIFRVLKADSITPVSALLALDRDPVECFLFESVAGGENLGRYSFLGVGAREVLTVPRGDRAAHEMLARKLRRRRVYERGTPLERSRPPFFGGYVGYIGYAFAGWTERLPDRHRDDDALPDAVLMRFDEVLVFDHVLQELIVVSNVFTDDPRGAEELLRAANATLDGLVERLMRARVDFIGTPPRLPPIPFRSRFAPEEYVDVVRRAKEEIAAGEIFQIVLSQRWETPYPTAEALTLYRVLRSLNPSPYTFLLRSGACTVVGASPEMLVRLDRNGVAETRPIAGTRARGASPREDAALEQELRADTKEKAEHLMLVDLGRNDLGRVCKKGTVEVTQYSEVERYSHVMHLVSLVVGVLRDDLGALDLLTAVFPAGTVSGAPKIRAMQLIDELEPVRRGAYAGTIAHFGFTGTLDSCITIRAVVLRDGVAHLQAGAGIVYDSVPERELEETVNKAAATKAAIQLAVEILAERGAAVRSA